VKLDWTHLDPLRIVNGKFRSEPGERFGAFFVRDGKTILRVTATAGMTQYPWEHASVCALAYDGERQPTWREMCLVKSLFWDPEECVVQFHPPESKYVNVHPNVLHIWKPWGEPIATPPKELVG
jgi:hypothetical protein